MRFQFRISHLLWLMLVCFLLLAWWSDHRELQAYRAAEQLRIAEEKKAAELAAQQEAMAKQVLSQFNSIFQNAQPDDWSATSPGLMSPNESGASGWLSIYELIGDQPQSMPVLPAPLPQANLPMPLPRVIQEGVPIQLDAQSLP